MDPSSYWVHNDSGGDPLLFCIRRSGASCGTLQISGAEVVDWEDIAAGPDGALYIGDIGDNRRERTAVVVYRVVEPSAPGSGRTETASADAIELRYPGDRSMDAEALMVHPRTGDLYVVTKDPGGIVFRAGANGGTLARAGRVHLPGLLSFPTGGDIAPDGHHVVIGTYGFAFELTLPNGARFDDIWRQGPVTVKLPFARQREAVAYRSDGRAIVTTSEGVHAPLVARELVASR
jgi:hypothetical protein